MLEGQASLHSRLQRMSSGKINTEPVHLASNQGIQTTSSPQPLVCVVLCTYNPNEDHLTKTLQALKEQTLPVIVWELILVDNNSDLPLEHRFPVPWHPNGKWLLEPEQGKVAALRRAFTFTSADLVVTIDDDNIPSPTYLATAVRIHHEYPHLGAFGAGSTEASYEGEPPSWFNPDIAAYLALRRVDHAMIFSTLEGGENCRPWGLGLCVTRQVISAWLRTSKEIMESHPSLIGRKGTTLDDDLFSLCAIVNGLSYGIFPELHLSHLIPPSRLKLSYLAALAYEHGYSHAYFALFAGMPLTNPMRIGSPKASLILLLSGKPKIAFEELRYFLNHILRNDKMKILRVCQKQGWDKALITMNMA